MTLHPGDAFPSLTVTPPGEAALRLPEAFAGHFAAVLFYRGSWCPYCNAQFEHSNVITPAWPRWTPRSSPSPWTTRPQPGP